MQVYYDRDADLMCLRAKKLPCSVTAAKGMRMPIICATRVSMSSSACAVAVAHGRRRKTPASKSRKPPMRRQLADIVMVLAR